MPLPDPSLALQHAGRRGAALYGSDHRERQPRDSGFPARSEGKRLGRPRIAPALEERIKKALATSEETGVRVIAKQFGKQSRHGTADQPPFRRRRKRGRGGSSLACGRLIEKFGLRKLRKAQARGPVAHAARSDPGGGFAAIEGGCEPARAADDQAAVGTRPATTAARTNSTA